MSVSINKLCTLATLFMFSSLAQATVLFESPYIDQNDSVWEWCSPCGSTWQMFDRFTLDNDSIIIGTTAQLNHYDAQTNRSINVSIRADDFTTELFSNTFASGSYDITSASPFDLFSFDLGSLSLSAGDYWISYFGNTGTFTFPGSKSNGGEYLGRQANTPGGTTYEFRATSGGFQIEGTPGENTVPEPSTIALLALGLLGLGYRAKTNKA